MKIIPLSVHVASESNCDVYGFMHTNIKHPDALRFSLKRSVLTVHAKIFTNLENPDHWYTHNHSVGLRDYFFYLK